MNIINKKEVEISTSKKINGPMNMAAAFQSCANRIQNDRNGKLEYRERYMKIGSVELGERYLSYESQSNERKELNERYKVQNGSANSLENIASSPKVAVSQENFSQEVKREVEIAVNLGTADNRGSNSNNSSDSSGENNS